MIVDNDEPVASHTLIRTDFIRTDFRLERALLSSAFARESSGFFLPWLILRLAEPSVLQARTQARVADRRPTCTMNGADHIPAWDAIEIECRACKSEGSLP